MSGLHRPLYYCGSSLPLANTRFPYLPVQQRGIKGCARVCLPLPAGRTARWAHQPALGSLPGRPPAAGPADRAHVTPASQLPGARRRARRWRGLLGTTNTGGTAGRARAPGRLAAAGSPAVSPRPGSEGIAGQYARGRAPKRAWPTAEAPGRESGLRSRLGASAALERGPAGRPGAEPGRAPDAAAGTAAVGAGRPRKWGCHRASCRRTGGRGVGHRG